MKMKMKFKMKMKMMNYSILTNLFKGKYLYHDSISSYFALGKYNINNSLYKTPYIWEGITDKESISLTKLIQENIFLQITTNKELVKILLNIKSLLKIIISILKKIKKILLFILIYKLLSLLNPNIFITYLEMFPNGDYIIERVPSIWNLDSLSKLFQLDKIFYFNFFIIFLVTLNLTNLMVIFILYFNFELYKINTVMNSYRHLIFYLQRLRKIWLVLINLNNIINIGLPNKDFLLIFNLNISNIFDLSNSKIIGHTIIGQEVQNNIKTNIDNSIYSSSQPQDLTSSLTLSSSNPITELKKVIESQNLESINNDTIDTDYDSDISIKTKLNLILVNSNSHNFNFKNFNSDLTLEEKYFFIEKKMYLKGVESSLPMIDWFIDLMAKSDGSKANIEKLVELNLNSILKMERNSQLNSCGFFRNKPFLITHTDKTPLVYPHVIPIFKDWGLYDMDSD